MLALISLANLNDEAHKAIGQGFSLLDTESQLKLSDLLGWLGKDNFVWVSYIFSKQHLLRWFADLPK